MLNSLRKFFFLKRKFNQHRLPASKEAPTYTPSNSKLPLNFPNFT